MEEDNRHLGGRGRSSGETQEAAGSRILELLIDRVNGSSSLFPGRNNQQSKINNLKSKISVVLRLPSRFPCCRSGRKPERLPRARHSVLPQGVGLRNRNSRPCYRRAIPQAQ